MKTFSKFEIATIKRTAQNVNPMVTRKKRLKEAIEKMQAEYEKLDAQQAEYEAAIKTLTGGYTTEDLVEKIVEPTTINKNGNEVRFVKYVLKYPDTVVPPESIEDVTEESVSEVTFEDENINTTSENVGIPTV